MEAELRDLPDRHHSMRAVFAQSWQRLGEVERAVFMRLSLFRDGFTRQAAQRVAGASLPTLSVLVNKSLVQRDADGRYNLHELLRQYAEEELEAAGQKADAGAAHAAFFLNFLQQREPALKGRRQLAALGEINENYENIRAAWLWAVQAHNYAAINHALNALFHWFFWLQRSRQHEGVALLQNARKTWISSAEARAHRVWGRIQARLLEQRGVWLEKPVETQQRIEEALLLARQHGDPDEVSFCTWAFGLALVSEEPLLKLHANLQQAIDCFEESLAAYRARGDHFWVAQTLEKMGHAYRRTNQSDLAIPPLEESLSLRRTLGDRFGEARSLRELSWAYFHQGKERVTLEVARAAYELQVELGDQEGIADGRFLLAVYLLVSGDIQQAKTLFRPVEQYAVEANSTLYREWTTVTHELIQSMEESMRLLQLPSPAFPNRITPFSSSLVYLMFSVRTGGLATAYHGHLQELFGVATTTSESALCLFLAPYLLAHVGEQKRAVTLMALAFRYPEIAGSWLLHLPWYVTLQEELRKELAPEEFAGAWAQGQLLDLQRAFVEVRQELVAMRHRLEARG